MKCQSCSVEIDRAFKSALQINRCPACGKAILISGNMSAFVPLCELLGGFKIQEVNATSETGTPCVVTRVNGALSDQDSESLATIIISTFNVRVKGEKEEQTQATAEPGSDAEHKQRQMMGAKEHLKRLREEALNEAQAASWGLTPGEETLDPDIGEALAANMSSDGPNVGQALVEQKQREAHAKMLNGSGKVKRG